ncbi:hypothetical protein Tco_0450676 [Tanacetum coccineum]
MGSTPLRRSKSGKNPVDVHASNVKSTEKSGDISKEIAEEGSRDSNGGSKKEKRYDAVEFKARKSPIERKIQDSNEVAPALFGNPIEVQSHHKPMHDMCPMVVLDGVVNLSDSSNYMVSDSHTSKKHMANATVINIPAKHDADATVLSEPIGDIPAIEEIASEQQDEVENVVSGDDAMIFPHAIEDPNKNGSNDISLHADSDQMGIPAANDLTPHIEYADGSHAVEDPNGTRPNHVAPNCNQEKAEDTTPSVQQVASLVFDHSMLAIPMGYLHKIHNDSHLLQQPREDRIQDQKGQADHTPMVEIEDDNMQNEEAIQVDQIIPEESSLNPDNEPSSVMSANPTITENQAVMLPTRGGKSCPYIQSIIIDLKEIAEAIAEIRLKYHNKRQEANATFNSRKKEVESNMYTLLINQVLAATFRQKCQDVSRGCVALQQACQAESMQQVHRFSPSTCLLGQFPGTQQTPPSLPPLIRATTGATPPQQKQPPCQIIHQPSALFLTPLTRHPHTTNLRPANTTPIRPPPNTETCGQSPQSRPLVSSVTRSTAPHMRPLVSREFQTPGPHMRPFASSGIRSSTSPMRPSNPASSSGPPGFGTYHRTLPVQHVTSSVPLTSPSNSQPLNSTSSVQPLPPLPWKRFPVPQPRSESPHASVATSAHSSLLRGPSVPQIGGPQDKLNDNVKTLTNAARALNILKTPEFPGGGNGA